MGTAIPNSLDDQTIPQNTETVADHPLHPPSDSESTDEEPWSTDTSDDEDPEQGGETENNTVYTILLNSGTSPAPLQPSQNAELPRTPHLLGNLSTRGSSGKPYLSTTLEHTLTVKALVDTASDITLMSDHLHRQLQTAVSQSGQTLTPQRCNLKVQAYSTVGTKMKALVLLHMTIGPANFAHPVYVSTLNTVPLLLGQDLLKRFKPLIDLEELKIWSRVRQPLPVPGHDQQPRGPAPETTANPRPAVSETTRGGDQTLIQTELPRCSNEPSQLPQTGQPAQQNALQN